jgi:hypothetical protein
MVVFKYYRFEPFICSIFCILFFYYYHCNAINLSTSPWSPYSGGSFYYEREGGLPSIIFKKDIHLRMVRRYGVRSFENGLFSRESYLRVASLGIYELSKLFIYMRLLERYNFYILLKFFRLSTVVIVLPLRLSSMRLVRCPIF